MKEEKKVSVEITLYIKLPEDVAEKFNKLSKEMRRSIILQTEAFAQEYLETFIAEREKFKSILEKKSKPSKDRYDA
jgi:hypothetical protein